MSDDVVGQLMDIAVNTPSKFNYHVTPVLERAKRPSPPPRILVPNGLKKNRDARKKERQNRRRNRR